jgi:DNA-binding NtrC family response regulator
VVGRTGVTTRTTIVEEPRDAAAVEATGLHLLIMSPDAFTMVPLPGRGTLTIGRSPEAAVQIEDPMASREHARLHIAETIAVEDVGSVNGTRVRDARILPGELVRVNPGEGIAIGSTVLMVQQNRSAHGRQRLWSHAYFETRLEAECARVATPTGGFALARLALEQPVAWTTLAPVFAREIPDPHVLAAYGPDNYEILILDGQREGAERLVEGVRAALAAVNAKCRTGLAWYPEDGRTVDAVLAKANARVKPPRPADNELPSMLPKGPMARIYDLAVRAAASNINVLILGETGVGKDVLARTIHNLSSRSGKPMLPLNCAGLAESLIDSELFGHERGAFTGANAPKPGLLETAQGGTVFLDEVGELPPATQVKLLRVIETREVMRVGALKPRSIDVRFIAATNRDLEYEVLQGTFRRDLFFRLNGISLTIPPLRERVSEIAGLSAVFIQQACKEAGRAEPVLSEEVLDLLEGYSWPGNIRELKNVIERAIVLCQGNELLPEHLPLEKMTNDHLLDTRLQSTPPPFAQAVGSDAGDERQRILDALTACAGNQTRAAAMLGIPRRTFILRLDTYGIPRPQKGNSRK